MSFDGLAVQPSLPFLLFLFLEKKRKEKQKRKNQRKNKIKDKKEIYHLYLILSYPPAYGRLYYARQKYESRVAQNTSQREGGLMGSLSKYEQETVINFNAGEQTAVVYPR